MDWLQYWYKMIINDNTNGYNLEICHGYSYAMKQIATGSTVMKTTDVHTSLNTH